MMNRRLPLIFAAALLGGCASRPATTPTAVSGKSLAATRPTDGKANLTLDQIKPAVLLPAPSTQPSDRPSLDAIELYARAVDEQLQNRRFAAINDLEKAVALDPNSAELRQALGRAYIGTANFNDSSIASLEKAAALQPDDLDVQLQLGRQYIAKNDLPNALLVLRRARLTTEYGYGDDQSALTDFFLATALQRSGYDRAAIDSYQILLERIKSPGPDLRGNPELSYLISRPDAVWIEMAGLYERDGQFANALTEYQNAADRDPANIDLQIRIVHTMSAMKNPAAKTRAAELVKESSARADTITLLRETYREFGNEPGAADVLRKMLADDPTNRPLLYALTGTLQQLGKANEARDLLAGAARTNHYPVEIVSKLQRLYESTGQWKPTALLLIEASQKRPDLLGRLAPMWERLLSAGARPRVRLADIQSLAVPADQQAAKSYWVSTLANSTGRDALGRSALNQAVQASPPFTPAYRAAMIDAMQDGDDSQRVQWVLDHAAGFPALSAELHGLLLVDQKKYAEAESAFRRAIELKADSPELSDELVDALLRQNQDDKAETLLQKIIATWPEYEPAYLQLVGFYASRHKEDLTAKTVDNWVVADPSSTTARLLQARILLENRRPDTAEILLNGLLAEESDNGEVLTSIEQLYSMQGRLDVLSDKLAELYAKQPQNLELLTHLVDTQLANHQPNEATRSIDAARITFVADGDALYLLSGLYERIDQKQAAEDTLTAALAVDPKNASANNDLGYNWIDKGKNIDQAESMIRTAVAVEPDNQAFLDSLGWVLYKRSQFAEAVKYLVQASDGSRPDPIVLDHLGDALYRANRRDEAQSTWQRAGERLTKMESSRDDLKQLRLQLNAKLEQAKAGRNVIVAPVIESAATRDQAKRD